MVLISWHANHWRRSTFSVARARLFSRRVARCVHPLLYVISTSNSEQSNNSSLISKIIVRSMAGNAIRVPSGDFVCLAAPVHPSTQPSWKRLE